MQEDTHVSLRIFSFGGGVQSVAALVLAAQGKIPYQHFVFANTGNDSENPDTLRYIRDVAIPFAKQHGLFIWETRRPGPTLYQRVTRPGNKFAGIPMRLPNGKPGRRGCTSDYKVKVLDKWLLDTCGIRKCLAWEQATTRRVVKRMKQQGIPCSYQLAKRAVIKHAPRPYAIVGMGISLDEFSRARTLAATHWKALDYPLLRLRLTRDDCIAIIEAAGLPVPPKSACWFCPFKSLAAWQELLEQKPAYFERAAELEDRFNQNRRYKMWLTNKGMPLRQAIRVYAAQKEAREQSQRETEQTACDGGHCWT